MTPKPKPKLAPPPEEGGEEGEVKGGEEEEGIMDFSAKAIIEKVREGTPIEDALRELKVYLGEAKFAWEVKHPDKELVGIQKIMTKGDEESKPVNIKDARKALELIKRGKDKSGKEIVMFIVMLKDKKTGQVRNIGYSKKDIYA